MGGYGRDRRTERAVDERPRRAALCEITARAGGTALSSSMRDRRSELGPDHPHVAIRLNNFAALLQATNRLEEAEPLLRRALAIDEASFGPDHPTVAIRLNNVASLLQASNRLAEAEPLMRRALVIGEASFGPDDPTVAIYLNISPHCWQPLTGWSRRNP